MFGSLTLGKRGKMTEPHDAGLKRMIEADEKRRRRTETLEQIAEIAFELVPDLDSLVCFPEDAEVYCHGCAFDYGKYKHEDTCLGVRIQELRKELER